MSNVEMEELNTSDNIPIIQITENGIEGFEILCRLCANKSDNLIPIYSEEGMTNDLSTKMNLYLPIKVAETDQLPLQCCFQCATTVLNWHELVVASVEADKRLRELHEEAEKHLQEQELSVKMIPGNEERTEIKQDDESDDGRFMADDDIKIEESEYPIENVLEINIKTEPYHLEIESELLETNIKTESNHLDIENELEPQNNVTMSNEKKYKCKICLKILAKTSLARHQKRCKKYSCNICEMSFLKKSEMYSHLDVEHKVAPVIAQGSTDSDDNNKEGIHRKRCNIEPLKKELPYSCSICEMRFLKKSEMYSHLDVEHKDAPDSDDNNKEGVPNKETQKFSCDVCSRVFIRKGNMLIHRERFHSTIPPLTHEHIDIWKQYEIEKDGKKYWKCDFCEKTCSTKFSFIDHHELHTKSADELRKFICEICGKPCRRKHNLQKHIREFHKKNQNEKNYFCEICGNAFKTSDDCKQHMNIHTDNRPYKCVICSKSFRQRTALWIHKKHMHSNEHKFSCNICDFKTHRSHVLKLHTLTHTGEKPHVCSVCGNSFRLMDALKRHMYTHKKEKIPCEICGAIFSQPRCLKQHMRVKHRGLENKN